jgi:hypothetical protein
MMGFWRTLARTIARNPISTFAVLCVACTAAFLGYLTFWLTTTLSSADWCGKSLQAERISSQNFGGLTACVDLLKIQLGALAMNSHIAVGSFALCLIVLIVVVIAGAKANFKAGKDGIEGSVSRDAAQAADHVVEGAEEAAAEVKGA